MIAAYDKNNVKVAVAHQTRYSPVLSQIEQLLGDGKIGRVLEYQMHGRRIGAVEARICGCWVRIFDLTSMAGTPLWVQGYTRQDGELVTQKHVKPGAEGSACWPATAWVAPTRCPTRRSPTFAP